MIRGQTPKLKDEFRCQSPDCSGPNSKIAELEKCGVYSHPMKIKVAPKGMGLNDFVAFEEGFFKAEGLDVEFDWKTFRGTQSSWKGMEYFERPQDKAVGEQVIQCACLWGTISNASSGMGLIVPDCFGISPWSIFVRPDSKIRKPEELRDIPIAVGMRAGSHFNVPYRLEKYMPLENIKTVNIGGFGARLKALVEGEVEVASLLPPQIDMAKQLGLYEVIADEFKTLWWVPGSAEASAVRGYLRGLDHAERVLELDLQKYLPLWKHCIPPEFQDQCWDFSRFSRGERFVHQPILREEFDEVMQQVERWGLDQYLKDRSFENLVYRKEQA
jgi:hypothetical protein